MTCPHCHREVEADEIHGQPEMGIVCVARTKNHATGEVALTTIHPLCHPREQCERARAAEEALGARVRTDFDRAHQAHTQYDALAEVVDSVLEAYDTGDDTLLGLSFRHLREMRAK